MYDYHLHSDFSGDCVESMEDSILQAIKVGGKQLCFTDHLDYDYPETEVEFTFDEEGFSKELKLLQEKYGDKIIIQKGIELGLQPHLAKECMSFVEQFQPDFVLCSFHVADRKDMYNGDFYKNRTPEMVWHDYFDDVLKSLEAFKDYSVVGHLDIPKRYHDATKNAAMSLYAEKLEEVLMLIIQDGKGIEVNMSGLRTPANETLPSRNILKKYYELGGQYITIGSDAHRKEDIYSHFKDVLEMLNDIGFEYYTIYDKRKPIQMSIKEALE